MYEQVMENLKKATDSSIQMQQEMMQKWSSMFPTAMPAATQLPTAATAMEGFTKFQKRWEEAVSDVVKRQRELVDSHYEAGLKTLHEMFKVGESRSPQEYQEKVLELYRKSFESLRALSESQFKEFKSVAEKWVEMATKVS